MTTRRVGIVGFGRLGRCTLTLPQCCQLHMCIACLSAGQYLYEEIRQRSGYEVAFVWNRSEEKMRGVVDDDLILHDLNDCADRCVNS